MPKRRLPNSNRTDNDSSLRQESFSRSSSRKRISEVFTKLADAFNKHAEHHRVTKSFVRPDEEEAKLPEKCRKDLAIVRALLPKLEKCFPREQAVDCDASDLAHLCDFYERVLRGVYCPHSPGLFQWGRVPSEIMLRVHLLLHHSICPSVITNASTPQISDQPYVAISIANTIAHLLSFMADDVPRKVIVDDLLSLLRDCSVVITGNILPSSISVWQETAKSCRKKSMVCELMLESLEQVWLLQTVSVAILHMYLTMIRTKVIAADTNTNASLERDQTILRGMIDMIFSPNLVSKTSVALTLAILRHMLLSRSPPAMSNRHLLTLRQFTALRVLQQLFQDWKLGGVLPTTLLEASVLVVRVTCQYLSSKKSISNDHESVLLELLVEAITRPPRLSGGSSFDDPTNLVHQNTLLSLLECIKPISKRRNQALSTLDCGIFQLIHIVLHGPLEAEILESAASLCLAHGIIPHLVDCMADRNLVLYASGILSRIMDEGSLMDGTRGMAMFISNPIRTTTKVFRDAVAGSKRKRECQRKDPPIPLQALDMSPSLRSPGRRSLVSQNKQNSHASNSYTCQMSSELRRLLEMALFTGRRLESWFKQESKRDDVKECDVALLLGTIRLMLSQVWENSMRIDDDSLECSLGLVHILLKYLKGCSDELMKSDMKMWSSSHLIIAQAVTSTGLYLLFFVEGVSSFLSKGHLRPLEMIIENFTHVASRLALADLPSEAHGLLELQIAGASSGDFSTSGILGLQWLETAQTRDHRTLISDLLFPLVGNATSPLNRPEISYHARDLDRSIILFDLLPLRSRSCLLAFKNPPSLNTGSKTSDFFEIVLGGKIHKLSSAPTEGSLWAVFFSPLYLSSLSRADTAKGVSSRGSYSNTISNLLKSIREPVGRATDAKEDAAVGVVLLTLFRLKTMCDKAADEAYFRLLRHPASIAQYIFLGNDCCGYSLPSGSACQNELCLDLCDYMLSFSKNVPQNHSNSLIRILRWNCIAAACIGLNSDTIRRHGCIDSSSSRIQEPANSWLFWLLSVPFSDDKADVRKVLSTKVHQLILSDDYSLVFALFATSTDSKTLADVICPDKMEQATILGSSDLKDASDRVVSTLFRSIDSLLLHVRSVADSQLSFTVSKSHDTSRHDHRQVSTEKLLYQRTALSIFKSLCGHAVLDNPLGLNFFEKSYMRLLRMWAAPLVEKVADPIFPDLATTPGVRGLAFGGFVFASRIQSLPSLIFEDHLCPTFLAAIFCDVLILSAGQSREVQFSMLQNFIQSSLATIRSKSRKLIYKDTLALIDSQLPRIVCQFVIEKDVELLRLTTSFREFLDDRTKEAKKKCLEDKALVGSSNESLDRKSPVCDLSNHELDRRTKRLCLQPRLVERILPLVLIHADREGLVFFLSKVLSSISLKEILQNREQLILKELVWALGRGNETVGSVLQAIRVAATALVSERKQSLSSDDMNDKDASLASQWVTSHFMYLLVNVIQYRWKARTKKEQLQAIRCMYEALDMLQPSESAQYFPQIIQIATISGSDGFELTASEISHFHCLRLFAVKSLSKFVQVVSECHLETIASNLTTIVVTLIPIVSENRDENESSFHWALSEAQDEAVKLLLFLATGEIGKALARCFSGIPFLPQLPLLQSVHEALRKNKVNLDDLAMLSSPNSMDDSSRPTGASDLSSAMESKSSTSLGNIEKLNGLQMRIHTMTTLLDNENIGVRNVVLEHLTDILRANRETFHTLVEDEGSDSMKHYLTVRYIEKSPKDESLRAAEWMSQGTIVNLIEKLLSRCAQETEQNTRILLAKCLGEVGAISELKIGDLKIGAALDSESVDSPSSMFQWRLEQPPWQSRAAKYELQLVTRHLVIALRAAPSSADQHKIAFTIQQLLVLLDRSARQNGDVEEGARSSSAMSKWLRDKLIEKSVLEVVEPFWSSEFHEKSEGYTTKAPPFFETSRSYYTWLSNFCRWMVSNSHSDESSAWRSCFFACRTAIRTQAGVSLAEFILPLLLLDRMCFGSHQEEEAILAELLAVFTSKPPLKTGMNHSDHQKAVNIVFVVMDTLKYWEEREVEDRFKSSRSNSTSARHRATGSKASNHKSAGWPADLSISRIRDIVKAVPLSVQAEGAARVGMHARALRLLEMAGRLSKVEAIFESTRVQENGDGQVNVTGESLHAGEALVASANDAVLMKEIFAQLDDCETMLALRGDTFTASPSLQARDSIRQKEASGDFEGALQDYERAMQLENTITKDIGLRRGILQCQLELGQFESVLNQVAGLKQSQDRPITSYAVEAAWRLGRWETLSDLVSENDRRSCKTDVHDFSIGEAIVGLYKKDEEMVRNALKSSRLDVMEDLSSTARESYSRSYAQMVRLQCIREIEDASYMLCQKEMQGPLTLSEVAHSTSPEGWAWTERLNSTTAQGASRVINSRLAIARLSDEPALEASLFLNIGKRARKRQLYSVAENFFSQAQAAFSKIQGDEIGKTSKLGSIIDATSIQVAKLKQETGESALALKILGNESMQSTLDKIFHKSDNPDSLMGIAVKYERQRLSVITASNGQIHETDDVLADRFAKRLLRLTQWTVEGGLRGGSEITRRYEIIHKLAPKWEKGHFHFGKYIDSMLQSRVAAMTREYFDEKVLHGVDEDLVRTSVIYLDAVCQGYILSAMRHYAIALKLDSKHVYQALPRLLSLWFDFASIDPAKQIVPDGFNPSEQNKQLSKSKNEANKFMASNLKEIPASAFYTAIPQLVSRVTHNDRDTAGVVYGILRRVLVKFPQQAMWPLACLKGSKKPDRQEIGENLFKEAQKNLAKNHKRMQQLLLDSTRLFKFLKELATVTPAQSNSSYINVKPWRGNVDLCEFVAPVQAALSISPISNSSSPKDFFPRNIPRMRAFSSRIAVMSSKARPKRITAFAVAGTFQHTKRTREPTTANGTSSNPLSCDVGEIHFLVKQEAKGDLRKDARVQDLNNVINRLMVSSIDGSKSTRRRRLHLRTFAVTCLSEDTGILEWVPETDSLRNLVEQAYNPQTSAFCPRRRGVRLANFGDASLRSNYDRCQATYFKDGNLLRATQLFQELCLRQYPPLLYWWFVQKFHDPNSWYEARNRFTLSAAVWSAVGHVIGLGDRHSENILVDTTSGECVHVDFDCIFDKGLNLPKPEVIPFRLTANMVDAFGPTGAEGIYSTGLQLAMRTLRENRDLLLSVLEPFLKDPVIDWKRYRSQQKGNSSTDQAKRSIKVIDERLRGIYNLRNPNLKKYSRTDFLRSEDDELAHLVPMSVEGQVNKMITEATAPENLVQLYVGWMPWV